VSPIFNDCKGRTTTDLPTFSLCLSWLNLADPYVPPGYHPKCVETQQLVSFENAPAGPKAMWEKNKWRLDAVDPLDAVDGGKAT